MNTNTQYSKGQLRTIVSALAGKPRNPSGRPVAMRLINASAEAMGITVPQIFRWTDALLDGTITEQQFIDLIQEKPAPVTTETTEVQQKKRSRSDGPAPTRPNTKTDIMLSMMRRPEGATIYGMALATGWQPQAVRGVIYNQKRRLGFRFEIVETGVYRIIEG